MRVDDARVLLVRQSGVTLVFERSADPFPLGTARRLLAAIVIGRLQSRRALDYCTLVSECLPSRLREGLARDTSLHDLLTERVPGAHLLLRQCLEAVCGVRLERLIDEEVVAPAGLDGTRWEPVPVTTANDLDRILCALESDVLVPPATVEAMLQRGYGISPAGTPRFRCHTVEVLHEAGGVFTLRYPSLDLTLVLAAPKVGRVGQRPLLDRRLA